MGAAGIPVIKADGAAQLETINATHITVKDLKIGGVPGVELSYQLRVAELSRTFAESRKMANPTERAGLAGFPTRPARDTRCQPTVSTPAARNFATAPLASGWTLLAVSH